MRRFLPALPVVLSLIPGPASAALVTIHFKPDFLKEAEAAVGQWILTIAMDRGYEGQPEKTRARIRTNYYKEKIWPLEDHPDQKSLEDGAGLLWELERMARWDLGLSQGPYPGQEKVKNDSSGSSIDFSDLGPK